MTSGNVSLEFDLPPKVPVISILLMDNAEFSARADLLFDSTCDLYLPADVPWSSALMSIIMIL